MPASASAPEAALPISWSGGRPIVETWIDGHGPLRFALDSGTPFYGDFCAVDTRLAVDLHLHIDGLPLGAPVHEGPRSYALGSSTELNELRTGEFLVRNVRAKVIDLSPLERLTGVRIDGVLPAAAFGGGLLTIDPARGSVTYAAGGLPSVDGKRVFALGALAPARFSVDVDVAGVPCTVAIDTGWDGFLKLPDACDATLLYRAPHALVGRSGTLAGIAMRHAARVDGTIRWGDCALVDPVVEIASSDFGMVGMRFLHEFRTTFDVAHDRIEFDRTSDGPILSPSIRGLGADFFRNDDMWTVWYVVKEAPAERAGLRVGDRIETIDGRPTSSADIDGYYSDLLAHKAGMKLRVVRDGVARDVDVAIVTLVE
jgi:hypothetical protein